MKFERGRKKNQLIWSSILKVIASQRLVKILFLDKNKKMVQKLLTNNIL